MKRTWLPICSLVAISPLALATDHFVNPGRPGAFATVQQAHDAAAPGDRILIEVDLPVASTTTISKSLTIESSDGTRKRLPYLGTAAADGQFLITALTPGKPLTLRYLAFEFVRLAAGNRTAVGIRTQGQLSGDIIFDHLSVDTGPFRPVFSVSLVDLYCSNLLIRHSRIVARDTLAVDGCTSAPDRHGSDGLTVIARILAIEDTEIVAGSASFLRFNSCSGQQQSPLGGDAGAAVRAEVDATVLVRSFFSDANGGDVQNGSWSISPLPGVVRRSSFVVSGAIFQAYNSVLEAGRAGRLAGGEDNARTAAVQISLPDAPFTVGGDGRLGGLVNLTMDNLPGRQAIGFLCFAFHLSNPNAQGHTWFDPRRVVLTTLFTGNDSRSFTVPNDPHLVSIVVVGQVFDLTLGRMVNPSAIVLRP